MDLASVDATDLETRGTRGRSALFDDESPTREVETGLLRPEDTRIENDLDRGPTLPTEIIVEDRGGLLLVEIQDLPLVLDLDQLLLFLLDRPRTRIGCSSMLVTSGALQPRRSRRTTRRRRRHQLSRRLLEPLGRPSLSPVSVTPKIQTTRREWWPLRRRL